jgi:hypothetical protein
MSNARDMAGLSSVNDRLSEVGNSDGALSNRNVILNGSFQVAQRGTSFTSNGYGLDRWKTYNSGGTATLSQQTFASGDSPEVGLDTYVRIVRVSPSGIYYFSQRVEDVRKSDGATLTLSFYGKASSVTTVPCRITQEFGSGGSSGVNTTSQNNNLTTSWQRFTLTFSMASLSGKTVGTGSNFEPVFDIPATTATIEITGVQLEVGDTATPFEHRSYGDELARCQRYYEQINYGTNSAVFTGHAYNSTSCHGPLYYNEKRSAPTITYTGTVGCYTGTTAQAPTTLAFAVQTTRSVNINPYGGMSFGVNDAVFVISDSSSNLTIKIDAEL